ncbi:MAG: redox-sensing transcriptional repressor Rex [Micrococcaceae bacterium]
MISRQRDVPGAVSPGPLSRRALDRLPVYLRRLNALSTAGTEYVSSGELAAAAGASRDLVRKDLSALGQLGRPGKGYPVVVLEAAIEQVLGISTHQPVILVGAGHLGTALVQYGGFAARGLDVVSVLDADPQRVGQPCGELTIENSDRAAEVIARTGARLAILTVPGDAAQRAVEDLVTHGIRGILNFAPVELDVPEDVTVRVVDVSAELQLLAFHQISGVAGSAR